MYIYVQCVGGVWVTVFGVLVVCGLLCTVCWWCVGYCVQCAGGVWVTVYSVLVVCGSLCRWTGGVWVTVWMDWWCVGHCVDGLGLFYMVTHTVRMTRCHRAKQSGSR